LGIDGGSCWRESRCDEMNDDTLCALAFMAAYLIAAIWLPISIMLDHRRIDKKSQREKREYDKEIRRILEGSR